MTFKRKTLYTAILANLYSPVFYSFSHAQETCVRNAANNGTISSSCTLGTSTQGRVIGSAAGESGNVILPEENVTVTVVESLRSSYSSGAFSAINNVESINVASGTIENNGTIAFAPGVGASDLDTIKINENSEYTGNIINTSTGVVGGGKSIRIDINSVLFGNIENQGLLQGRVLVSGEVLDGGEGGGNISNSGRIECSGDCTGEVAILVSNSADPNASGEYDVGTVDTIRNTATGVLDGDLVVEGRVSNVANAGQINGSILNVRTGGCAAGRRPSVGKHRQYQCGSAQRRDHWLD